MQSPDMIQKNIDRIAELFPNVITEKKDENGLLKKIINFEKLKHELADEVIDGEESYDFTWVGKKASIIEANTPIRKTLRPCIEESKDWETTGNLYIEGDNLDVLKLLQESYLNSIKMIYIDPPYNTGKDFIYKDNFKQSKEEYEDDAGTFDEEGNRLFQNTETNGRFHSDWCSMLYPRLKLAYNLLREDGVIFISIDDNEVHNLKKLCDEVFGEGNFASEFVIKSNPKGSQSSSYSAIVHEYVLCYAKNKNSLNGLSIQLSDDMINEYNLTDKNGNYRLMGLRLRGGSWRREDRPFLFYPIYVNPKNGLVSLEKNSEFSIEVLPIKPSTNEEGTWRWGKSKLLNDIEQIIAKEISRDGNVIWDIYQKDYLQKDGEQKETKPKTIWDEKEINYQNGTTELKQLFDQKDSFDFPKPKYIIQKMINMSCDDSDIILDFFSGSATTAHAAMQLNADDCANRKFIMVQLPESCNEKSEASKTGYNNICEIGKERIRRAGEKIKNELITKSEGTLDFSDDSTAKPESLDIGFRVLKVDSTNMKDVYYAADEYEHNQLDMFESNIKDDRTPLDLLYQCLLDWGLSLSLPHTIEKIDKVSVHTVDNGSLVACFDDNVPESVVREIAKRKPLRVVFKDSSFTDSPSKINVSEIFKTLAPGTTVKVI
jgi:adenine-specific DNA-methyltransferase